MSDLPTVTLHAAAFFTCDDCGRDSFVRLISVSTDEAEALGLEAPPAIDLPEVDGFALSGTFEYMPAQVKCNHCGAEFNAEPPEWAIPLEGCDGE